MKRGTNKNRKGIKGVQPDIRHLKDMEKVVYDRSFAKRHPELEVYYMYRGIDKVDDLRYDITVMPSQMLGKEFPKTKGHGHLKGMQELYTILEGEVIFLMQKSKDGAVTDVYAVKAQRGDWAIVPPNYAHVTINPSGQKMKMANWVSQKCQSSYGYIEKMAGACYFYTKNGWIKNENYKKVPEIRWEKPLKEKPGDLGFLK